jgi:hypothetical protein
MLNEAQRETIAHGYPSATIVDVERKMGEYENESAQVGGGYAATVTLSTGWIVVVGRYGAVLSEEHAAQAPNMIAYVESLRNRVQVARADVDRWKDDSHNGPVMARRLRAVERRLARYESREEPKHVDVAVIADVFARVAQRAGMDEETLSVAAREVMMTLPPSYRVAFADAASMSGLDMSADLPCAQCGEGYDAHPAGDGVTECPGDFGTITS